MARRTAAAFAIAVIMATIASAAGSTSSALQVSVIVTRSCSVTRDAGADAISVACTRGTTPPLVTGAPAVVTTSPTGPSTVYLSTTNADTNTVAILF